MSTTMASSFHNSNNLNFPNESYSTDQSELVIDSPSQIDSANCRLHNLSSQSSSLSSSSCHEVGSLELSNGIKNYPSNHEVPVPQPVPPKLPIDQFNCIYGISGLLFLLYSAYVGSIFMHAPLLLLASISPRYFRYMVDLFLTSWLMFAEFIICRLYGIRVRQFGDSIIQSTEVNPKSSLFLLNHRTQLDWFFVWGLGNPVQQMKIILKESLARVPGAGWSMQCGSFIFLRRRIATDEGRLKQLINYLLDVKNSCQLLIFPEGTDLNQQSLQRSDEYAVKNKLPLVRYTLHPRSTGFVYLVNTIGSNHLTEVYDVTVAYPDIIPSPEINLFYGHIPHEVHYYVRRFSLNELPDLNSTDSNQLLAQWLQTIWLEKEEILKQYYARPISERRFPNEINPQSLTFQFNPVNNKQECTYLGLINTFYWFVFMIMTTYFIYHYWLVFIYFIGMQLFLTYLTYYADGISIWVSKFVLNSSNKNKTN